jgi:16S rRNA (uracil1498-N3)-methyltransferase
VRRLEAGDSLEVFDGTGRSFEARISSIDAQKAEIELGPSMAMRSVRSITLVQALPKAGKMEWILQKATELGASAFAPAFTKRSVPQPAQATMVRRVVRWQKIVEEAARQCGRNDVPRVSEPRPVLEVVKSMLPTTRVVVLNEREPHLTLSQVYSGIDAGHPIALVTGPEGSFEDSELASLLDAGATSARLGERILRTETASVAALAILLHLEGRLG